jgi:hypothetical protein
MLGNVGKMEFEPARDQLSAAIRPNAARAADQGEQQASKRRRSRLRLLSAYNSR